MQNVIDSDHGTILRTYRIIVSCSDEFILLYDANMSKDIYPYWKYLHFDMKTFGDQQCIVSAFSIFKNSSLYTS